MLNVDTGEEINTLYKFIEISGGSRKERFQTSDINRAIKFHKWYVKRYRKGLLLQIIPEKKVYDWKDKKVDYTFE